MEPTDETPRRRREDDPNAPKRSIDSSIGRRASDLERAIAATALASAMDAIVASDHLGKIIVFNPAAERLFGYTPNEAIGKNFSDILMAADIQPIHEEAMRRHLAGEPSSIIGRRIESTAINKDGDAFPVEIALTRDDSWATPIFTAVIRDVRERRGFESALQQARDEAWAASDAKSEFIAVLSHELRTPLSSIVTSTALLEAHGLDEESMELLRVQRDAGEALLALTENILDVARIEAGYEKLDREPFDPKAAARQAMRIVASRAQASSVTLSEEFDESLPQLVVGDLRRWRQVLLNLLTNALKFTQHGSVSVALEWAQLSSTSILLRTIVTDTGMGMDEDALDRVFQRFQQADDTVRASFGGSGLGLHIVRRMVDVMGGTLSAGSTPGVGSTFAFSVPVSVDLRSSLRDDGTRLITSNLRVLLVEDHDVNRRLITKQLQSQGHDVIGVESASEALSTIWLHRFDIVLMDVGLPDADGFAATRLILEAAANRGSTPPPVVALTAGDAFEVREAARAAGMSGFLTKPLRLADWQYVVEDIMTGSTQPVRVAAPPQLPDELDLAVLAELSSTVGWKTVLEATLMFVDELPTRVTAIKTALAAGSAATVASSAHELKGVAGTLGAARLADVCRLIESRARDGELPDPRILDQLDHVSAGSAQQLLDYVRAQTSM